MHFSVSSSATALKYITPGQVVTMPSYHSPLYPSVTLPDFPPDARRLPYHSPGPRPPTILTFGAPGPS